MQLMRFRALMQALRTVILNQEVIMLALHRKEIDTVVRKSYAHRMSLTTEALEDISGHLAPTRQSEGRDNPRVYTDHVPVPRERLIALRDLFVSYSETTAAGEINGWLTRNHKKLEALDE